MKDKLERLERAFIDNGKAHMLIDAYKLMDSHDDIKRIKRIFRTLW